MVKSTAMAMATMVAAAVLSGAIPATIHAGENGALKARYNDGIQQLIAKHRSKLSLQRSRSANLQAAAADAGQKLAFLIDNREALVAEMVRDGIGIKPHQIDYYVNKRFHETRELVSGIQGYSAR